MNYKYYYVDHHLISYYSTYNGLYFKTREEYLNYCSENNIELHEVYLRRKNKFSLEWEYIPPSTRVATTIAIGTEVFDNRDLSCFYFETEEEAFKFLDYYKEGSPQWALEALFSGVEGEPDYSPEALCNEALQNVEIIPFDSTQEFVRIAHYIISYYPEDIELKKARKAAHLKQIQSIKATTPYAKIYIIAQNYAEEDYIEDPQIVYYKYEPLGAMKARNTALKHFYDSNYDFCILSDDDTVLIPDMSAKHFAEELEFNTEAFKDVDIIWSRDMYHMPFQRNEIKNITTYSQYWKLTYSLVRVWHYAIIRNFKKYYNKEEYQDESVDPTTGVGYDDADFAYYLHTQGYQIFDCCHAFKFYSLNWVQLKGSLVYSETTNPWIRLNNATNSAKKWFYNPELERYKTDAEFRRDCNRTCTGLTISRTTPLDYLTTLREFKHRDAVDFIETYIKVNNLEEQAND